MRTFKTIYAMAAKHKGGAAALEALLPRPKSAAQLAAIPDDRWLSQATQCVFNAGFNWSVIEKKWSGFETAFEGFALRRCAHLSDEDFDRLLKDVRIVRNAVKIRSVARNAQFMLDLAREYGSVGKAIGGWPSEDIVGLFELLKTRGDRLGGGTGQMFVRFMGKDGFILSPDVTAALIREGVIDKPASSKAAMRAVQSAFNAWSRESGRPLMQVSRTLAASVG